MKKIAPLSFILIFLTGSYSVAQLQTAQKFSSFESKKRSIVVEMDLTSADVTQEIALYYCNVDFIGKRKWDSIKTIPVNKIAKWIIITDAPNYVRVNAFSKSSERSLIVEPGDELKLQVEQGKLSIANSGPNINTLQHNIDSIIRNCKKPANLKDYRTESLNDYYDWHSYLNNQLDLILPIIESYKGKISDFAFHFIKSRFIDQNIDDRSDKFHSFLSFARDAGITNAEICKIYDSTYYTATENLFEYTSSKIYGNWKPIWFKMYRNYSFNNKISPLNSSYDRMLIFYNDALKTYSGEIRQKFIADVFTEEILHKLGFTDDIEKLLVQYYSEPGFPKFKEFIKKYELEERERLNEKSAPAFALTDINGQQFTKEQIKGKIAVFDFWFTGCPGCVQMVPGMQTVQDHFKKDTNVIFINVSVDTDKRKWLNSISERKYTTGNGINLYTGGMGSDHSMIRQYAISGYPALCVLDPQGRFIRSYPRPDPRNDNGKVLIDLVSKQLSYLKDGPYILYDNNNSTVFSVSAFQLSASKFMSGNIPPLIVRADNEQNFTVKLRDRLNPEPSIFEEPQKLLALSDIEGNFQALRELLQANGVIDRQFNWTFGNGHLVFAGDIFDRGHQVTECLWLIYYLEQQAKKVGGYVHFILGNHEIINLYGDHSYAQPKYVQNAALIGKSLKDLFSKNSELGRWLRTKNIIEKIGDLLFVHGGIAKEFADSVDKSIDEINAIARQHLGERIDEFGHSDQVVRLIYSTSYSPFWFRSYYENGDKHMSISSNRSVTWTIEKPDELEMNKILRKWNVTTIVTGHTIVADTISAHYNGKIINIDTHHAVGKSEALLLENGIFYRVNAKGKKQFLLKRLLPNIASGD